MTKTNMKTLNDYPTVTYGKRELFPCSLAAKEMGYRDWTSLARFVRMSLKEGQDYIYLPRGSVEAMNTKTFYSEYFHSHTNHMYLLTPTGLLKCLDGLETRLSCGNRYEYEDEVTTKAKPTNDCYIVEDIEGQNIYSKLKGIVKQLQSLLKDME